jgi:hypothetical protein
MFINIIIGYKMVVQLRDEYYGVEEQRQRDIITTNLIFSLFMDGDVVRERFGINSVHLRFS